MCKTWKCRDGSVVKRIQRKGRKLVRPRDGAECQVDISILKFEKNSSNRMLSDYLNNEYKGKIVIGEGDTEIDRQIEECLMSMEIDEQCLLSITFSTGIEVDTHLTLKDFINVEPSYKWSREKKLSIINYHKAKGVDLFQEDRVIDAFLRFSKAIKLVITLREYNDDKEEYDPELKSLYVMLCNNMAYCQLKQNNTEKALELLNKVISNDPSNVKALMRRGEAYMRLKDTESSYADFKKVREIEPNNAVAREKMAALQQQLQVDNAHYKTVIKKMFPYS